MRQTSKGAARRWKSLAAVACCLGWMSAAQAASFASVSPQGEVAQAQQLRLFFNENVVPLGDPRQPEPATLRCEGTAEVKGAGRWSSAREWLFELNQPLPAGTACRVALKPEFKPGAEWSGPREFAFQIGAPRPLETRPWSGQTIEEDQQFLLQLSGPVQAGSLAGRIWCEVEGLGERIPAVVQPAAARDAALKNQRIRQGTARSGEWLLLACQRPLPPEAMMRLVWGRGIAAAANPAVQTRADFSFKFQVRKPLTAEFSCQREKADAPCMPILAMSLRFSEPVTRALALQARLKPAGGGKEIAPVTPKDPESRDELQSISFPTPLPENTSFQLMLPAGIKDASGRTLGNASMFPLTVRTGIAPPIAKFAAAPFGIIEREAEGPALLPLTLRHVQGDLRPAASAGRVLTQRFDRSDAELLQAYARIRHLSHAEWETRKAPMLETKSAKRLDLPVLQGGDPRPFEVIGVPLAEPGYHVVELQSQRLGASLLEPAAPMYVRTGVLVTNLGLHFKLGRESSLAWVTTLDRAKPVAGAEITVMDCHGKKLWSGRSDAQGLARITQKLERPEWNSKCVADQGLFVTARAQGELAFMFTSWQRGIEGWRFNVPTGHGSENSARAHTVMDRPLLRAGETVSMKHFFRLETAQGLALAPPEQLPSQVRLIHEGSGQEFTLPLSWQGAGRFASNQWAIPPDAKLGGYRIELRRGEDRIWVSGGFRVEEFRVPLVDARINVPAQLPAAPRELKLGAQLNYMAGGAMARAPLKLSALLRPLDAGFAGYEDFSFALPRTGAQHNEEDAEEAPGETRLVVDKQAAQTDAQGAAELLIRNLPKIERPSELLVELGYNDPNGELQTLSRRLPLWPAKVVAGVRAGSWAGNGQALRFQALALSTDGKPLAGQRIVVRARKVDWISSRKRMVGGFYAYDNKLEVKELGEVCSGSSDAQGRVNCEASLTSPGQVELIARVQDEQGMASEAATQVWITRQGEFWFAQDNDDRIDLLPEKQRYEPGETARLQLRTPFREATALVTIEREGVIETRVQTLQGRDPVVEIKVERDWSPNVYVSVLAVRGRIREVPWYSFFSWGWRSPMQWWKDWRASGDYQAPTALVDLGKPAYKLGLAGFEVGMARHQLKVEISSDKPQYGVRQKVQARVRVTQDGKPVPDAELAFAAVDEGLLALRANPSWDLLPALIRTRPLGVETSTAQGEIIGRRHYGRKAIAAGGGGGRATRELFDTLLLWKEQVRLDANGEALIEVPLNDSLTSFRLVAVADAGAQRFGTGMASVRVSQDLQLLSGLPPLVREGDQLQAAITLRNASSREMKLKVELKGQANSASGSGAEITRTAINPPAQELTLAAGGARELVWPVQVPMGAFSVTWEAQAQEVGGGNAVDRLKLNQLVQPAVPLRILQSTLSQLEGPQSVPVAAPADALPAQGVKRGGLQIALQPRLSGALPGLKRFFETYPYTCLEQLSSKAMALHDEPAWTALMGKLPTYLDSDGLANYFPPRSDMAPQGSDRLTAHLLSAAHEAGRKLPEDSQRRMLDGLAAFVEGRLVRKTWAPRDDMDARRIAALEALSRYGRARTSLLSSVDAGRINSWPTATLIDWLSLHRRLADAPQREARLAEVQAQLRAHISYAGSTLRFVNEDGDNWWWLMDSPDANASRLILALLDEPGWKSELPRLVVGNLARQQRGAWQTTTANLWGVLALEKFAARFESGKVTGRSVAQLGKQTEALDWARQAGGGTLQLAWPEQPGPLQVKQEGTGKPWMTVQSLAAIPTTAPLNAGYRITRSVQALEQKDKSRWSRGDLLRVRLEVEASADMTWVVISDPVPAGASIMGGGSGRDSEIATRGERREGNASPAYEERGFEAWRGYYDYLPRGKHVVEYTVRLNSAGRFQMPVSRVEAMYAPDRFGEFPNATLEVGP